MAESRFYTTDPSDPDAPVLLQSHKGLRAGMTVEYTGPIPLDGPLVITELLSWSRVGLTHNVQAILNDGEYEVDADNLCPV